MNKKDRFKLEKMILQYDIRTGIEDGEFKHINT